MSDTHPVNADPFVETVSPENPGMDYPGHYATYNQFVHLVRWFCLHMAFILVGLYFLIIGEQPLFGTVMLLAGIAVLVFGITRNPDVRHDLQAAATDDRPKT